MSGRLDEIDAALANFGVSDDAIATRRRAARQADIDLASVDVALSTFGEGFVSEFSGEATGEHELDGLFDDVDTGDAEGENAHEEVTITSLDDADDA